MQLAGWSVCSWVMVIRITLKFPNLSSIYILLIYKVVLLSHVLQGDSVIHIHLVILFRFFSHILSQNIEQSSLCYTVDPY